MSHNDQALPDVSAKSTKNEILEAYNALLSKISETKQVSRQDVKKQQDEIEVVRKASNLSGEKIAKGLMELKLAMVGELDTLEQQISSEYKQLVDLQNAVKIEAKNLQDLYEIKKNADSLSALLLAQTECKERFDAEMLAKKSAWTKEQDEFETSLKETIQKAKRDRLREEEEYNYNLKLQRKKDSDIYQAQQSDLEQELEDRRSSFQKEFAEREFTIKSREEEFKKLQDQVRLFPQELEKAIRDTAKTNRDQVEAHYKHQIDLSAKEVEGERKLNMQIIASLQSKIKEQELFIKQLTQKADDSTNQVQAIALKAIEGASNLRFYGAHEETKKSQSSTGL